MAHETTTLSMRLFMASEQLRLTATSIAALAHQVDDDDAVLTPHIERLEHRAAELMRTALRLAHDAGLDRRWGLDVLFATPDADAVHREAPPLRTAPADESIDLDPLSLMEPFTEPVVRMVNPSRPPWMPSLAAPSAPEAIGSIAAVLGEE